MRTFIAIDIDDGIKKQIAEVQNRLRPQCGDLRWVNPKQIHLTLKFLGEINGATAAEVGNALTRAMQDCPAFDIEVGQLGVFDAVGPVRVVWMGIDDVDGGMTRCFNACEKALVPLGFPREHRAFHPHLTLARNKSSRNANQIRQAVSAHADVRAGVQFVSRVTLYQSTLTREGSIYQPLSHHALVE